MTEVRPVRSWINKQQAKQPDWVGSAMKAVVA